MNVLIDLVRLLVLRQHLTSGFIWLLGGKKSLCPLYVCTKTQLASDTLKLNPGLNATSLTAMRAIGVSLRKTLNLPPVDTLYISKIPSVNTNQGRILGSGAGRAALRKFAWQWAICWSEVTRNRGYNLTERGQKRARSNSESVSRWQKWTRVFLQSCKFLTKK